MKRILPALLIFLVAIALPALTWNDSDNGFLSLKEIRNAAARATTQNYPNADTVLVDSAIKFLYNPDGTYVQVHDYASKALTQAGADASKVLTSYYDTSYARAKISLVQVLKPTGETVTLDLASCTQDMTEVSQMDSNIYNPNSRLIKVTVAELQPGDILRAVYVDEILKPRVPNSFSSYFPFESTDPILHSTVEVNAPAELPLMSIAVKNPVNGGPKQAKGGRDGRIIYTWEVADVPQFFPEPSMPSDGSCVQRVLVSTFTSWEEVSRWYSQLSEPHLAVDEAIAKAVQDLTAGCKTDRERIVALYNFVSQRVRYMGLTLEDTAPGYEPHDVVLTFEQRAGVCRDVAALLVAMLRTAGYDAHPTLIQVGYPKDVEVPQPYFNHAITAVRDPDTGKWLLMDPTNSNTRDPFPAYLSDKSYLVATPKGETLLLSPVTPSDENLSRVETSAKLTEDGTLQARTQVEFHGIMDNIYRNFFLSMPAEQRRFAVEQLLASVIPGVRLDSLQILPEDLLDLEKPTQIFLSFAADNYLVTSMRPDGTPDTAPGKAAMLKFPRLAGGFGLNFLPFRNATLDKRRFPFETKMTCEVVEEAALELPASLQVVSLPEYTQIDNDCIAITRSFKRRPDGMALSSRYASKVVRFSPEEYLELKGALAVKDGEDRKMPILQFQAPPAEHGDDSQEAADTPNTEILESSTSITVESQSSYVAESYLKYKVATYAGIGDSSDITLDFNPAWEELEVLSALVTNDGVTTETPKENINLMDASWNASAPRYPGAKTLVVNLPGIEVGSVVELRLRQTSRNQPFFHYSQTIRSNSPIKEWSLEITAPKSLDCTLEYLADGWLNMKGDLKDPVKVEHKKKKLPDDMVRHTLKARDIPALPAERNLPPTYSYLPTVVATTGSWPAYAGIVRRYVEALGNGGETVRKLAEPCKGLPDEEKIVKIRDWIEKNIRSEGPAFNTLPLSCMTPPEVTAADGYGNSADQALLYHAMLQAAGLKPQLYLASATPQAEDLQRFYQKYPSTDLFDTWLVKVNVNGRDIWLNDQKEYAQFGTSAFDHGMLLPLDNGRLEVMDLPEKYKDNDTERWLITVNDDGSAQIEVSMDVSGAAFGAQKRMFERMTPEERRRHYVKMVSEISQDATPVTADLITNFKHYPGNISFTVRLGKCASFDGDYCYLRLPISLASSIGYARGERKHNPLYRGSFQNRSISMDLKLPAGYPKVVIAPAALQWRAPDGAGYVTWKSRTAEPRQGAQRTFHFEYNVELKPGVTPIRLVKEYQEAYRRLMHPASTTLLLSK